MKPTHDYIIEANEVYIQLSFGRYKEKILLRKLKSVSMYICLRRVKCLFFSSDVFSVCLFLCLCVCLFICL